VPSRRLSRDKERGQALDDFWVAGEQASVSWNKPVPDHRALRDSREAYRQQFRLRALGFVFSDWDAGQRKKALRLEPEGLSASLSVRRFA